MISVMMQVKVHFLLSDWCLVLQWQWLALSGIHMSG